VQERPVSISAWTTMFSRAGFTAITASSIVAEAGLVCGQRPDAQSQPTTSRVASQPNATR